MFKLKQFSSGEHDLIIDGRINHNGIIVVDWNWFKEKDIMIPLMKADAIRRNYPNVKLILNAPYLPYQRQDRIFEAGQGVPAELVIEILKNKYDSITTMGNHRSLNKETNILAHPISWFHADANTVIVPVFPDISAGNHYKINLSYSEHIRMLKNRNNVNGNLSITNYEIKNFKFNKNKTYKFIIHDDICSGGRTFIEAAKFINNVIIPENELKNSSIELLVYHAFLDYGIDNLVESGISKILIINKDSFEYINDKFKNLDESFLENYFKLKEH